MRRALVATALALAAPAAFSQATVTPQDSGVTVRLRGISAVNAHTAWASGREGTVLRTMDGGAHWTNVSVPDAKALDFRDIEGFDANTAVVLSIGPGEASRVYRTEDGGKTWTLKLKNDDERASSTAWCSKATRVGCWATLSMVAIRSGKRRTAVAHGRCRRTDRKR